MSDDGLYVGALAEEFVFLAVFTVVVFGFRCIRDQYCCAVYLCFLLALASISDQ